MGVVTTEKVCGGKLFGPIRKNLTLVDLGLLIGHMTCDDRPDVHKVKLDVNAYSDGALLGEWVPYVQAARDDLERNVEASVRDGQVFYRTTRSIAANQSLLVWYSPAFASALGVPPLRPEYLKDGGQFVCPLCLQSFKYPHCMRAHLRFKCKYYAATTSADGNVPRACADRTSDIDARSETYCSMLIANNLTPPHSANQKARCSAALQDFLTSSPTRTEFDGRPTGCVTKRCLDGGYESNTKRTKTIDDGTQFGNYIGHGDDIDEQPVYSQKENVGSVKKSDDGFRGVTSAFRKVQDRAFVSPRAAAVPPYLAAMRMRVDIPRFDGFPVADQLSPFGRHPYAGLYPRYGMTMDVTNSLIDASAASLSERNFAKRPISANSAYMKMLDAFKSHPYAPRFGVSAPFLAIKDDDRPPPREDFVDVGRRDPRPPPTPPPPPPPPPPPSMKTPALYRRANPVVEKALRSAAYRPLASSNYASLNMVQNWCVKCNATFRMTSDLVYHMRSHHHRGGTDDDDPARRKRDDKLCCDVCGETFRERHHLSRHMTSHV